MIVEFTGCTGAGKTTLVKTVARLLSKHGISVRHNQPIFQKFRIFQTANNLLWELKSLKYLTDKNNCYRDFTGLCRNIINDNHYDNIVRINMLRSIIRKVGTFDMLGKQSANGGIALLDEGVVHIAHNLFVHPHYEINSDQLEMFMDKVPLPDIIVNVTADKAELLNRLRQRKDSPGKRRLMGRADIFINKAQELFSIMKNNQRLSLISVTANDAERVVKLIKAQYELKDVITN
jgi:thymidylate kinase